MSPRARLRPRAGAAPRAGAGPLRSALAAARQLRRLILAETLLAGVLITLPGGVTGTLIATPLARCLARSRPPHQ
jgi:hypothetical protein